MKYLQAHDGKEVRDEKIAKDREKGSSYNQIAIKYGISKRWAIEIVKKVVK